MAKFDFLPQTEVIRKLLGVCETVLERLPKDQRAQMEVALRAFEAFGTPVMWSEEDVDMSGDRNLSQQEKRLVIASFIDRYEVRDGDWSALEYEERAFVEERGMTEKLKTGDNAGKENA